MNDMFNALFVNGAFMRLDEQEQHIARVVYPVVYNEVEKHRNAGLNGGIAGLNVSGDLDDPDGDPEFNPKISVMQENMQQMLLCFRKSRSARRRFLHSFPQFSEKRMESIKKLLILAMSINKDRHNSNIAKLVGSSVSLAAALAVLASVACPPAAPVIVPAAAAGAAGAATTFGTTIAELELLRSKTNEAKVVVENDQENFVAMQYWFENSIALTCAIEAVLGFEVGKKLFEDLKEFVGKDITEIEGQFARKLRLCIQKVFKMEENSLLNMGSNMIAIAVTFFSVMVLMHKRNCVLFDCTAMTIRVVLGLISGLDLGIDLGRLTAAFFMKGGAAAAEKLAENVAMRIFHGVFAGISAILDLITIILTSDDINRGSISEQAIEIENCAVKLSQQLDIMKQVYEELERSSTSA